MELKQENRVSFNETQKKDSTSKTKGSVSIPSLAFEPRSLAITREITYR